MVNEQLSRKQNDGGPPISDTLNLDGSGDDLTGATVRFTMWPVGDRSNPKVDKNTSQVTVEDAGAGDVKFDFANDGSDLDTVGDFYYEWQVDLSSGETRTFPNDRDGVSLRVIEEGG